VHVGVLTIAASSACTCELYTAIHSYLPDNKKIHTLSHTEQCEMLRKFMMVGLLIFISPGDPAQLAAGLLITLFFLFAHLLLQPFSTPDLNQMQAVSQGSLVLTLFVGLITIINAYMKKEQQAAASGPWGVDQVDPMFEINNLIFSTMAVVVNVTTMIIPPLLMFKNLRSSLPNPKEVPGIVSGKISDARAKVAAVLLSVKVAVGLAPKTKEEDKSKEGAIGEDGKAVDGVMSTGITPAEQVKKLRKPGSTKRPRPLQPVALDARAEPALIDDLDKLIDDLDKNAALKRMERKNSRMSAAEFCEQSLQGAEHPKLTAKEDLEQEHTDRISSKYARLRKLAEFAGEFKVVSDTHLMIQPPPRQGSSIAGRVSAVDATNGVAGLGAETSGPGISGAAGAIMAANKLKKLRKPGTVT
jgi:hypothetical protein